MEDSMKTLLLLLKENRGRFHISYKNKYANHMSHGLIALYKLGAPSSTLQAFFDRYSQKLEPKQQSQGMINQNNWAQYVGNKKFYADNLEFFKKEIQQFGVEQTLAKYVPSLIEGVSGWAFHGVIELGYALELLEDKDNIAEGLANLSCVYCSKGKPTQKANSKSLVEILQDVKNDRVLDVFPIRDDFRSTMELFSKPEYQHLLEKYDLGENFEIQDLINASIELFMATGASDFFLLHGVTATRSVKTVLSHILNQKDRSNAIKYLWRGLVCTYIAQGRPELKTMSDFQSKLVSWEELIQRTLQFNDVHLYKLVFVCHEEFLERKEVGDKNSILKETALTALNNFEQNQSKWVY